jgi:hypothetical protein
MTGDAVIAAPSRAASDAQVIARARTDPRAFAAIFDRHHDAIHAYLRRRLDAPIAEELAAETFIRALRGIDRYDAQRADGPGIPRDDQFFYVASEGTELTVAAPTSDPADSYSYLYTKRREIWQSVDRGGLLRQRQVGPPRWLTPRDRNNWIKAGRPDESGGGGSDEMAMPAIQKYYLGEERLTTAQLRDYDPAPEELYDRLRANVGDRGQSREGEVFVEIADALRESPQTPRLRATLYRALALVPGVQLLGASHDRLGRAATGVAFTQPNGERQELLFDPDTAEILEERGVVAHRMQGIRAAVGTVVEDIVYTARAVTDATERP